LKIINNGLIKDSYDVVVVGAGIGGITAGALLANKSLSVLVVEQHYLPGGVCSSVKRKGFAMDAGAAMLFGWGKGPSPHRFVMNEIEEEIDMIPHDCYYRMHFGDRSVTFWKDFDCFFKELCDAFPGKEEQLKGFYDHTRKIYDDIMKSPMPMPPDTMPLKLALKMFFRHPMVTMRLRKYMDGSLKDILDLYVKDPEIEGLFDLLITTCYCTTIEETPQLLAAPIVWETFYGGACYPAGSPQMLPNKLEKGMEKNGGQILYRHMVKEILIDNGKVYGVRLDDGTLIGADRVISDATIWNLYGKLIKPEYITPERMEWAQNFVPTLSCVILLMGVDAEVLPEDTNAIEVLIGDLTELTKNNYFLYIPSIDDPSICPEGTHSISVLCSTGDYDWPRPDDPRYQSEEYKKMKEKFANEVLDVIETKFPGIKDHIITLDVATPGTTERFTLRNFGNVGGPKQMLGQHILNRLGARTEFKNLYCVGDSTTMGEGVVSATSSAVGAVNMILKDLKMKPYLPRNYSKEYINHVKGKPKIPMPSINEELTGTTAKRASFECQWCEDAKCMKKCPAGIDVLNFIRRIEVGNYEGAVRHMREMNPFAEICGHVCPAENLCESECYHLDYTDEPTRIKKLQAWVCKQADTKGWDFNVSKNNGKKVAIVGAGPAGLSCAYFLVRLGYNIDIFEKENKIGGVPTLLIPPFRLSDDVLGRELKGIISYPNINLKFERELGKNLMISDLSKEYNAVFLAPGLYSGRRLQLPGTDGINFIDALSLLKEYKQNRKYYMTGKIVVIGGGSVATDAANVALKCRAEQVTMVCLESYDEMPCLKNEKEELKAKGIQILNSWGPNGLSGNKLSFVCCKSVFDKEGKFCPKFDDSKTTEIEFDTVIIAIGQEIESKLGAYLEKEFGKGLIKVDEKTQLIEGQSNIYAGGDIVRGAGTVVAAVADGRRAAIAINEQLNSDFCN